MTMLYAACKYNILMRNLFRVPYRPSSLHKIHFQLTQNIYHMHIIIC